MVCSQSAPAEVSGKCNLSLAEDWSSTWPGRSRPFAIAMAPASLNNLCSGECHARDVLLQFGGDHSLVVGNRRSSAVAPSDRRSPVPNPNPISSLVLPPTQQAPVSPAPGGVGREGLSLLHPYHSVCSVFRHGPCFPYYWPPIGQDLRLTIVSNDENASQMEHGEVVGADEHPLELDP